MGRKTVVLATVCSIIIVVVFFEFIVFRTSLRQITDPYYWAYYDTFHKPLAYEPDVAFSPPVSMYHALIIALNGSGLNATTLQNKAVYINLEYCAFVNGGFTLIHLVTSPPADWSPEKVNDTTTDRYVWIITVGPPPPIPPGHVLVPICVDAATGEIV